MRIQEKGGENSELAFSVTIDHLPSPLQVARRMEYLFLSQLKYLSRVMQTRAEIDIDSIVR